MKMPELSGRIRRSQVLLAVLAAGVGSLAAITLAPAHAEQVNTRTSQPATAASPPVGGLAPGTEFTPVMASVISRPEPVKGSDGRYHLAYELLLTNGVPAPLHVTRLTVTAAHPKRTLLSLSGSALARDMNPIASPPGKPVGTTMAASTQWVAWLDVQVASRKAVPAFLDQHVTGSFLGKDGKRFTFDDVVGHVRVRQAAPVVLGSPVGRGVWFASEGCCTDDTHHRRGLAPINGQVMVPQRFAIDWFKLDSDHRAWVGSPKKLSSYLSFRRPVFAAANGIVVGLQKGLANNRPPEPPPIPPIKDTVGNHIVIKVRPGLFLLYAHLQNGSLRVHLGQRVHRGQMLARIGNSGNSTTPHLHFQIMTRPTFFPTDSRPYVFRRFDLLGRVPPRIWDDNLGLQPTGKLPFAAARPPGARVGELPLDRTVIRFP